MCNEYILINRIVQDSRCMEISYVIADLDLFSDEDISALASEIDKEKYCIHVNEWVDGKYRVSLGGAAYPDDPEATLIDFCEIIEGFSDSALELWKGCSKRIIDVAFESGEKPNSKTFTLGEQLIDRMSTLGLSIAITIYPVGAYS